MFNKNKCYIQVLNPTNDPIHLHSGLILASISEIDSANIFSLDKYNTKSELPINQSKINQSEKTDITFDLSKADLNSSQKQKLISFLNKNRDVFATSMQELGKTDIF